MKNTIEKLWGGNIAPYKKCGENEPEIKKLLRLMDENYNDLSKELNDTQKAALKKYTDCTDEYLYFITAQAFCDGFSLASQLLTEALQ